VVDGKIIIKTTYRKTAYPKFEHLHETTFDNRDFIELILEKIQAPLREDDEKFNLTPPNSPIKFEITGGKKISSIAIKHPRVTIVKSTFPTDLPKIQHNRKPSPSGRKISHIPVPKKPVSASPKPTYISNTKSPKTDEKFTESGSIFKQIPSRPPPPPKPILRPFNSPERRSEIEKKVKIQVQNEPGLRQFDRPKISQESLQRQQKINHDFSTFAKRQQTIG
jgi:hypothetical protein